MATTFHPMTLNDVEAIVDVLRAVSDHEIAAADTPHDALGFQRIGENDNEYPMRHQPGPSPR